MDSQDKSAPEGIYEVEAKYRLEDSQKDDLIQLLAQSHARFIKHDSESDAYYSRPDRDFMLNSECLRICQTPHYAELTYKPGTSPEMSAEKRFWKKEVARQPASTLRRTHRGKAVQGPLDAAT